MANIATGAYPVRGIWCHALDVDPALAPWARCEPSAIVRVSALAGSATTGSGVKNAPEATTVIRDVVPAAATSPAQRSAGTASASATTRDSVPAR